MEEFVIKINDYFDKCFIILMINSFFSFRDDDQFIYSLYFY